MQSQYIIYFILGVSLLFFILKSFSRELNTVPFTIMNISSHQTVNVLLCFYRPKGTQQNITIQNSKGNVKFSGEVTITYLKETIFTYSQQVEMKFPESFDIKRISADDTLHFDIKDAIPISSEPIPKTKVYGLCIADIPKDCHQKLNWVYFTDVKVSENDSITLLYKNGGQIGTFKTSIVNTLSDKHFSTEALPNCIRSGRSLVGFFWKND